MNNSRVPETFEDFVRHRVGKNIRRMRRANNWTMTKLSQLTGFSDHVISRWEGGLTVPNTVSLLWLCKRTGWKVSDILGGTKDG